jgi:thioredoxin-dependent peroxiredoxin
MKAVIRTTAIVAALFIIVSCTTAPKAGDKAPPFQAPLDSGKTATLQDLMGDKGVVLYFYPKDETPGCVTQACTFQGKLAEFQKAGYTVVGVSEDTPVSHQTFRSKHNLTFSLVSDKDHAIAKLYNVPVEADPVGTVGFRRTTFVISKDGVIRRRFEVPSPEDQVNMSYRALSEPF